MINKATNKEVIKKEVEKIGYTLSCYDNDINKLSKVEFKKVIDKLELEYTDVDVKIRNKIYVVEISTVDNEKDFNLLTQDDYISRYGDERWNK